MALQSTPGQYYDPYASSAMSTPPQPTQTAPYSSGGSSYNGVQSIPAPTGSIYYGPGGTTTSAPVPPRSAPAPTSGGGMPTPPAPSQADLNAAYDPLLNYLGQAEGQLRSDFPSYVNDVNNSANTARQSATNAYNSTTQQLTNQGESGAKQRDTAVSNAQRLYQELQQANLQRFGAGGTGQFASELQGRELQNNVQSSQDSYTNLSQALGQKKVEVDANYQVGLKQIEDSRTAQVNQLNRDFQDKLSQINQNRGAVESEKAQARLGALQQYRDQVYAIQIQNYQQQQTLKNYYTQQTSQLQEYANKLGAASQSGTNSYDSFSQGLNIDPRSQYAPQGGINYSSTPNPVDNGYVGQIMGSNVHKDQFGNIIPASYPQ